MQLRRTKIVATLGPATDDLEILEKTLAAGVDTVRLNFSHGTAADHKKRIEAVRKISKKLDKEIGVLADLQGPKIRISKFKNLKIKLNAGDSFILDADLDSEQGDQTQVGIDYKNLPNDVTKGDTLLLDDGRLVFEVTEVKGKKIHCTVTTGGILSNNKGINRLGGGLSAKALTDKDKEDLKIAVALDVDYIAISFPRSAQDVEEAKLLIKQAGGNQGIISKIERAEAVTELDAIIEASSWAMVARGDLGV